MTGIPSQTPNADLRVPDQALLNAKARSGTAWIVIAFGAGQAVRLALNIALAALLVEEAFALMALVTAVMIGLAMFSDIGLQQNVVQSPRGDEPDFLNTAWTLQVIRGVILTLIAVLLAWPLSVFYGSNDPAALELRWLIPLVGLTALLDGIRSPRMLSAARHMQIAQLTRIEVGVTFANTIIMLGLAWYTRSVYALAVSSLLAAGLHTALSYLMLPGPKARFTLDPTAVHSIFTFGKWIFLSTVMCFLALQIDRLTFAALYPLAEVGVYSIAASLALLIPTVVGRLQSAVVFPWYARVLESGTGLPEAFSKAQRPVMAMSTYVVALLIVGAESFIELAYDERYAQAALFLPVLAFSMWFSSAASLYGPVLLVKGLSRLAAMVSTVKVVVFALLFAMLSRFESTILMATGVVLVSELAAMVLSRYYGWRLGLKSFSTEISMLLTLIASAGLGLAAAHLMESSTSWHPALRLVAVSLLVTLCFSPLLVKVLYPLARLRRA